MQSALPITILVTCFSTGSGGLATVGVVCNATFKARGTTGSPFRPTGEAFYLNLVIHEMGHQLGGSHTFNANVSGACGAPNQPQRQHGL